MGKSLIQKLGLLGVVSFLSYTAAVVFAPLAYPGYNWMAQAVSDLSAANAPSLALWNQLSALYNVCEVVCVTVVCIGIGGAENQTAPLGNLFVCCDGVDLSGRVSDVSALGQRLCRRVSGCHAHGHHRFGGAAVHRIADRYHRRRSKKQGLPFLRSMRGRCPRHDARRCYGHETCLRRLLRRCGALQRVCCDGFQCRAGHSPVLYEYKGEKLVYRKGEFMIVAENTRDLSHEMNWPHIC